jgi:transcriptional regulator with XRE-family HTH domain
MNKNLPRFYDAVLARIRDKIEENDLTQAAVGEALGIKQSAVSQLMKGKTKLNLEQFMALASLLGEAPHRLIAEADASLSEDRPMPEAMGQVLFKSALHLLAFCAAAKPVKPADIANNHFSAAQVKGALEELLEIGLLKKKGDFYEVKDPHIFYRAETPESRSLRDSAYLDVHQLSHKIWQAKGDDKAYRAQRFNYFMMDYFTPSQIAEVEEFLWRAYERLRALQRENQANGLKSNTEELQLWLSHFMLMTPLKD